MSDFAVVPIFVNAGAAVLPAVVGGLASAVAMLLKPRELGHACRQNPLRAVLIVTGIMVVGLVARWSMSAFAAAVPSAVATPPEPYDWARVGRTIVAQRLAGRRPTSQPTDTPSVAELILGRDAGRSGHDGGVSPTNLVEVWSHAERNTSYLSSPVVRDDRVFGAAMKSVFDKHSGYVFAADAVTGRLLWRTAGTPGGAGSTVAPDTRFKPFFSSPALSADGKRLVIGQGIHDSTNCALLCLDADTGKVLWQAPTPLHIESSPAIRGDLVVVGAGAIENANGKAVGDPGFVLAVSLASGRELWRYAINDPECSPVIDEAGIVYAGSAVNGNAVVALRSEPGDELKRLGLSRQIWRAKLNRPVVSPITLVGDLVIFGSGNSDFVKSAPRPDGMVVAVDRKTGKVRWSTPTGDSVLGCIAHHGGRLAVPINTGHVALLDAASGRQLWRIGLRDRVPIAAGCAFTGSHVYTVSKDGWMSVFTADGKFVERVYVNEQGSAGEKQLSLSTPTIVGGRVYVGSENGGVKCFASR